MKPLRALQSNRPTLVMAILNMTPDSFSDGGQYQQGALDIAISLANNFSQTEAAIIDVGGQSTAPGVEQTTGEEEISRVVRLIRHLKGHKKNSIEKAISIDTYRSSVAIAAVEAGAEIINDVSAGQMDPEMLPTMARLGKTVCLMHMRGTPQTMNSLTNYSPDGVIPTIAKELLERVAAAEEAGIRRWRIILDPGIGFAKTSQQNLEILRRFDELRDWPGLRGLPWLVGSSRKNFIGKITGVEQANKRTWGTAATVAAAVQGGADIVRVHDVSAMVQVAKMSDAIWRV
jgi:2-amino-4-hydroxy-6-hydroxymethyldihydropteridine diphosphokinase/dihydropteroate synthase